MVQLWVHSFANQTIGNKVSHPENEEYTVIVHSKWLIQNYKGMVKQRPWSRSFPWAFLSCLLHDSVFFLPAGLCLIYLMPSNLCNNWSRSPQRAVSLLLLFLGYVVKAHLHTHKGAQRDKGRVWRGLDK